MSKFERIRLWATPVLLVLVVLLGLAYLTKLGIVNPSRPGAGKDTLAAVGSICTAVTVLVTGVLAYYRFFRGRTFTLRLELNGEVTMVDGPQTASLGLLTTSATSPSGLPRSRRRSNIGTSTDGSWRTMWLAGRTTSSAPAAAAR